MRISQLQKDILCVLYLIEKSGSKLHVQLMKILKMVNMIRSSGVFPQNLRASCHTLTKHQLLEMRRGRGLTLEFKLTRKGREIARPLYKERFHEENCND